VGCGASASLGWPGHGGAGQLAQYAHWKRTQLIIDVIEGTSGTFSLEGPEVKAFHTRSRVFTDAELAESIQNDF